MALTYRRSTWDTCETDASAFVSRVAAASRQQATPCRSSQARRIASDQSRPTLVSTVWRTCSATRRSCCRCSAFGAGLHFRQWWRSEPDEAWCDSFEYDSWISTKRRWQTMRTMRTMRRRRKRLWQRRQTRRQRLLLCGRKVECRSRANACACAAARAETRRVSWPVGVQWRQVPDLAQSPWACWCVAVGSPVTWAIGVAMCETVAHQARAARWSWAA